MTLLNVMDVDLPAKTISIKQLSLMSIDSGGHYSLSTPSQIFSLSHHAHHIFKLSESIAGYISQH
jgi:hypothetical protein